MNNAIILVIISDAITFVLSMLVTLFVAGIRWGEIRTDVSKLKDDISQIKGMFVVKLRDEHIER